MNIVYGDLGSFPLKVTEFIQQWYDTCKPDDVHFCNDSEEEKQLLIDKLLQVGTIKKLPKYENCYLARTSPEDVARVESRTFICTKDQRTAMAIPKPGVEGKLGNWANDTEMREKLNKLFDGCMKGRTMYVLPYCMGPLGSELSKIGVQITDSPYVVVSMGIMTSMGDKALKYLNEDTFVKCVHSVGCPLPLPEGCDPSRVTWPCNPENTFITQFPDTNEIISIGSGYGGNSLLGKKCFALRMASNLALKEGWLSEHMLISGLTNPQGHKKYICAAFPSACGKTNLAMMTPTLPGWKVTCVGDDISWMRFDKEGNLRAINPEKGFFGVCPGTSSKSNPIAMKTIFKDTIFTNVCETSDGGVFWEGLEDETDMENLTFTDWLGKSWTPGCGRKAAHPNSRFCSPIRNCPILDEAWDDPAGVPISAIIFGARRPNGIPLVYQSFSWSHGVLVGASMRSETTAAAADVTSKSVVHDPFAMRPFFGYNVGKYFQHWLDVGSIPDRKLPKIFHVNWFLKDSDGKFIWPGFGDNSRVLKWVFERCDGVENHVENPIGFVPTKEHFDIMDLEKIKFEELFMYCKKFWEDEVDSLKKFFENMVGEDFPKVLWDEIESLRSRIDKS